MFRDKDEALARLTEELLEEDRPQPEAAEDITEEAEEDFEEFPVRAYNGDTADVDLYAFSEEVYDSTMRKKSRLLVWFFLLLCGIFCVLAWWVLRYKGVI